MHKILYKYTFIISFLFIFILPLTSKGQEVTVSNAPLTPVQEEPLESRDQEVFGEEQNIQLKPVPQNIPQNIQNNSNVSPVCETATMAYQKILRDIIDPPRRNGFTNRNETYKILLEEWRNIHQRLNCDPITLLTIIDNTTRNFLGIR